MKTVFIFHGSNGHPGENWFPWLRESLESLGLEVIVPQFPAFEAQTLEHWRAVFDEHKGKVTPKTIMVGHSLGGAFLLRILEQSEFRIRASFLVSVPIGILPIVDHKADTTFTGHPFDWTKIRNACRQYYVFHSDDDSVVCPENGLELARNLDARLTLIPGGGHCNTASGYIRFERLLEKMLAVL